MANVTELLTSRKLTFKLIHLAPLLEIKKNGGNWQFDTLLGLSDVGTRTVESNPGGARVNFINDNNPAENHAHLRAYGPDALGTSKKASH